MLRILLVAFISTLWPLQAETPRVAPPPAVQRVTYRFENPTFYVSKIEMVLVEDGNGRLVFTKSGVARPVQRSLRVGGDLMTTIAGMLERLNFLGSSASYQGKTDHPNLGTVTILVQRGSRSREVAFNYTEDRDMQALMAVLRGISTREIYAFDLETAMRYLPLETPKILHSLTEDIARRRVADPLSLVPLLRDIAGDFSLPLIARNRAGELADTIEKSERR